MRIDKYIQYLVFILVIITFGLFVFVLTEDPSVRFTNIPFPTDKSTYHPTNAVEMTLEQCADETTRYSYTQKLVNLQTGIAVKVGEVTRIAKEGCTTLPANTITIPKGTDKGTYIVLFSVVNEREFMGRIYSTAQTDRFNIVPSKAQLIEDAQEELQEAVDSVGEVMNSVGGKVS